MKKKKALKWLLVLCALFVGVVCVKAEDYVKWKRVSDDVLPVNSSVVVIVDLNTGLAMSNDKADKDPDAVAVTLNYDKDRILGEVPENVQWTFTNEENGSFKFTANGGNLYADGGKLKVGSDGTDNVFSKEFIDNVGYLKINNYLAGVEESMFSNTWKLKELKDGKPDDKVKDTRFAIFEKVVDSKKVPTLAFPHDNYEINAAHNPNMNVRHYVQFESAIATNFTEYSDDKIEYYITKKSNSVFVPVSSTNHEETIYADELELYKSGTDKLIARIQETTDHDKAVAVCTIRYNNTWEDSNNKKGTIENPLTVAEAIKLAKDELTGYTLEEDRCYFIKGKVNKVNSGMMAMFGDMGLDEMLGDDMDMEEMMGDMDDFDMTEMGDMMGGMDFMSMIPGFGGSDGLTYYISDNGTKDNRIKVTNGRGLVTLTGFSGQTANQIAEFDKLEDLSPGDDVLVYGPLVLSEDKNMFAGLMEGIGGSEGIPGMGQQSDYEWAPISLDKLEDGEVVLLVDNNKKIALKSDLASSSVTIKNEKIADDSSVSENIQWTLTKNGDGTVTFKKDGTPLSVTTEMNLTVGQGQRSDFTYNNGILGIDYGGSVGVFCIKWDGDNKAVFGKLHNGQNTEADFTFYKKVQKTEEDKRTVKVSELNYLHNIKRALVVPPYEATDKPHMYENTTKSLSADRDFFYTINSTDLLIPLTGTIQPAQVKSADEEIAKWVMIDETNENSDSLFTAVEKGKTKITVKVKVIVAPAEGDNKEKSYTMKRKFQLEVLPRDKEPEGKNVGEYVLVQDASELKNGTRLLIIGTRTKTDTENNTETTTKYALSANNSMMGGGKGGTKVDDDKFSTSEEEGFEGRECIKYEDVPEGVQEIILEKQTDGSWYLNVGKDENGNPVYLYASVKAKEEGGTTTGSGNGGGFNMDEMMEMFNPSSGLKVGTVEGTKSKVEGVDSLKATISISNDIATIKFPAIADDADKNTIVLASSFDMESMMNMFSSEGQEQGGNSSSFNMGSFDMFMASFNTKKPKDIDGKKAFLPRIFGFVQYDEYPVAIGDAEWKTIVSDYDVKPGEGVEAYVVTALNNVESDEQTTATLKTVEQLKGGEPYLLHSTEGTYTMKRTENVEEPEVNLLEVSSETTTGGENSIIYVLADKEPKGVGFYKWTGGLLGAGRVYLPVGTGSTSTPTREFVTFGTSDASGIVNVERELTTEGQYYMLDGRLVETPTKGLYIVNGKKVVIK